MRSRFTRPTVEAIPPERIPATVEFDEDDDVPEGYVASPVRVFLDTPVRRRYDDRDRHLILEDWIVVAWVRDPDERTLRFVSTSPVCPGDTPDDVNIAYGKDIFRFLLEADLLDEEDDDA